MKSVDVIIPTCKPGETFLQLLDGLQKQIYPVRQVIVMNTERRLWHEAFPEKDIKKEYPFLRLHHIAMADFDHAGTRRAAVELSDADFVLMMTQDAVPKDEHLTERLLRALEEDERAAASFARQLPRAGASPEEAFERSFNYPEQSSVRGRAQVATLGFKAYYCSNVCAMYRRKLYDELGGFVQRAIFNEDVLYAAKAVHAGYHIRYVADAQVIHSHGYTCMQQLHRNFDQGVSQAMHPEVFQSVPQEGEGVRLVKACCGHLLRTGQAQRIPYFLLTCAFRLTGYRLGKHYRILPQKLRQRLSMNKTFFAKAG